MLRPLHVVIALVGALLLAWVLQKPGSRDAPERNACAGQPLRTVQARNEAMESGYTINARYDCIDRQSFDAVNAQRLAWEQQREAFVAQQRREMATAGQPALALARHGFISAISVPGDDTQPLPQPPASLFVRSDYRNPQNHMLAGYITPDPQDGRRHPAIIWLTGGDTNSLADFWTPGPDANDQSARAFREAGMIMMFPTLRGGNGQANAKELLLGEVEDVLAAARQLAAISYVDPDQIYLGGHSSGGTLALLTAEMPTPFKAVFALGPVASADRYPPPLRPADFTKHDAMELRLRSPIHWLDGIGQPTYVIEGVDRPANKDDVEAICALSRNPQLRCISVRAADHFSVIRRATRVIAAKLASGPSGEGWSLAAEDFEP